MAVELNLLLSQISHMDVSIIAGKKGLSNMVNWVHMIETAEASTFLEGGEIAFATGIGLNNNLTILELVESIYSRRAAGVFLNIGPFIENIPKEVVEFGNSKNFPIFTVPWKTHIAEIMRIFSSTLVKSEQTAMEIASAFKYAIFFPKQEELYFFPLSEHGFRSDWNYYSTIIYIDNTDSPLPNHHSYDYVCLEITNYLTHHKYKNFSIFFNDNQLIAIAGNYSENLLKKFVLDIEDYLTRFLPKLQHFYITTGKSTKSIRCLYKSYNQAKCLQNFIMSRKKEEKILNYSDMGIYKLLLGIEDQDIIREYYDKTIAPLIAYDDKNGSDLADVLWCYLSHNGSVRDTADELFLHRNTVNYKLNKAGEILNLNLSNLDIRLQLTIGFMLRDMIN